MYRNNNWRRMLLSVFIFFIAGCATQTPEQESVGEAVQGSVEEPIIIQDLEIASGQTIFIPAYSEVYFSSNNRTIELAVTLSIHNTDFENSIILTSVRYYDTQGQLVREYLDEPQRLGPLSSNDFFVDAGEQTGGIGTNFIVEWISEQPVYEPIVEALMLSTEGTQGISFSSPGRVISQVE